MTAAHEATACGEVGLKYAMVCAVDNMCHGVGKPFDLESFHAAQAANLSALEHVISAVVPRIKALVAVHEREVSATPTEAAATAESVPAASGKIAADLVVHAKYIVPVEPMTTVLEDHALVVHKGKIVAVLPSLEASAKYAAGVVVHRPSHALTPGFINCHTHLGMTALRGLGDDKHLFEWLSKSIWPVEGRLMSPEFVRAGARVALAELVRGGVTCVNDMYFFPDVLGEELLHAGVRGCVGAPVLEFPSAWADNADDYLHKAEATIASLKAADRDGLLCYSVSPHAPYTVKDETFTKVNALADRLGVKVHVHLHETSAEVEDSIAGRDTPQRHMSEHKCSPVTNLIRLGALGKRTIAVHMANLTDEQIPEVAESGASVVHCPHSNMKLASGFCRVADLMRAGVNVALGTDSSASNNKLDMVAEMRTAALLAKPVAKDPTVLKAPEALRMATLNGAIALGIESLTGSLEVGKSADFIAIDLGEIESHPLYDVHSHLVYSTDRAQVNDVWVMGRRLLSDRRLTTVRYEHAVAIAKEWAARVKTPASSSSSSSSSSNSSV
jgi:5-methylthioadenosine/S-adenosylhomocysteine deaminase